MNFYRNQNEIFIEKISKNKNDETNFCDMFVFKLIANNNFFIVAITQKQREK